ncbi:MAG: hypothetical protein AB7N76_25625 [Planctomycetota bacterium]
MKRGALGLGSLLCLAAAIGAYCWRAPRAPAPATPTPGRGGAPASPAPSTAPQPAGGVAPSPGQVDLNARVGDFFTAMPVAAPAEAVAAVVAEARRAPPAPPELRRRLQAAIGRSEGAAREAARLLASGLGGLSAAHRFQAALAIADATSPAATEELLAGLGRAAPEVRPELVLALRGSAGERVERELLRLYVEDQDPATAEQAAFVLGERGERVPAALLERARARAREDLRPGQEDARRLRAAADILGAADLTPADKALCLDVLARDADAARRRAAWRALAGGRAPLGEVLGALRQVVEDPRADAELKALAREALARGAAAAPPR